MGNAVVRTLLPRWMMLDVRTRRRSDSQQLTCDTGCTLPVDTAAIQDPRSMTGGQGCRKPYGVQQNAVADHQTEQRCLAHRPLPSAVGDRLPARVCETFIASIARAGIEQGEAEETRLLVPRHCSSQTEEASYCPGSARRSRVTG